MKSLKRAALWVLLLALAACSTSPISSAASTQLAGTATPVPSATAVPSPASIFKSPELITLTLTEMPRSAFVVGVDSAKCSGLDPLPQPQNCFWRIFFRVTSPPGTAYVFDGTYIYSSVGDATAAFANPRSEPRRQVKGDLRPGEVIGDQSEIHRIDPVTASGSDREGQTYWMIFLYANVIGLVEAHSLTADGNELTDLLAMARKQLERAKQ